MDLCNSSCFLKARLKCLHIEGFLYNLKIDHLRRHQLKVLPWSSQTTDRNIRQPMDLTVLETFYANNGGKSLKQEPKIILAAAEAFTCCSPGLGALLGSHNARAHRIYSYIGKNIGHGQG